MNSGMNSDRTRSRSGSLEALSELQKLNERSRTIFRQIVESYLATGDPVGSRNLARHLPMTLSPASIRNVMSDLEHLGFIYAPHTSAGRLPTEAGLRLFVDGLLEIGDLTDDERRQIEAQIGIKREKSLQQVLSEAGDMISGLSHCAGLVISDRQVGKLKHIEFVQLEPGKAHGHPGRRRPERGKSRHQPAGRVDPIEPDGGRQLSQCPHPRPDPGRSQNPRGG